MVDFLFLLFIFPESFFAAFENWYDWSNAVHTYGLVDTFLRLAEYYTACIDFHTSFGSGMEWCWVFTTHVYSKARMANNLTSKYGLQKKNAQNQCQSCWHSENWHRKKVIWYNLAKKSKSLFWYLAFIFFFLYDYYN